uniref:Uncharacterized protein n=1 Tax=Strongyloides venezuelensis TaxID=75913 RepID=A0A0K0F2M4_STRVS
MIFKNSTIILFIILINIIDIESRRRKNPNKKLRVWGRIDCRNRLVRGMHIGLYQFDKYKFRRLLKKVPCRCDGYFDIRAREISHPKLQPFVSITYMYINGRYLCKTRAIASLPIPYDNNPDKYGKSYYLGTVNILKMYYDVSNCYRIRKWTRLPKFE